MNVLLFNTESFRVVSNTDTEHVRQQSLEYTWQAGQAAAPPGNRTPLPQPSVMESEFYSLNTMQATPLSIMNSTEK